jgi:hypothetical protein
MQGAVTLMDWYIEETFRFLGTVAPSKELKIADKLLKWINDWPTGSVTMREILWRGPSESRIKVVASAALATLLDHNLIEKTIGRTRHIKVR